MSHLTHDAALVLLLELERQATAYRERFYVAPWADLNCVVAEASMPILTAAFLAVCSQGTTITDGEIEQWFAARRMALERVPRAHGKPGEFHFMIYARNTFIPEPGDLIDLRGDAG